MERRSKQVIVMRKDLNMRKGKMCSQAAHASLKAILQMMNWINNDQRKQTEADLKIKNGSALHDWIRDLYTKITVSVNTEQELIDVYEKAKAAGLPCALITDAGLTEFKGIPTLTCCAIGPAWNFEVDEITGKLPLL